MEEQPLLEITGWWNRKIGIECLGKLDRSLLDVFLGARKDGRVNSVISLTVAQFHS